MAANITGGSGNILLNGLKAARVGDTTNGAAESAVAAVSAAANQASSLASAASAATALLTASIPGTISTALSNVVTPVNPSDAVNKAYVDSAVATPITQVSSDWNASSGVAQILNKPTLGTAAATASTAYATAAQGTLAATAVQPGALATVATSGAYSSLSGLPTLGTAAATASTAYATAAQGILATNALPKSGGALTGAVTSSNTITASNLSGTNTGDQTTVTGNAGTATTLATARTISGVSFNGSANIVIPYSGISGTPTIPAAQVSSDWNASSGVAEILNKPTLGTAAATASTAYATAAQGTLATNALPKSGGALTGAVTSSNTISASNISGINTGDQTSVSGNAGTATTLATARTIGMSGITATATSFNGSANIVIPVTAVPATLLTSGTIPVARSWALTGAVTSPAGSSTTTLSSTSVTAGTYGNSTYNMVATVGSDGRLTSASSVAAAGGTGGTAAAATKLATARNIAGHAFDGTADITIAASDVGALGATDNAVSATSLLGSTSNRGVLPSTSGTNAGSLAKLFFTSKEQMEGNTGNTYGDTLVLDSYSDATGGMINALVFLKGSQRILHYTGAWNGTAWNAAKVVAYTDSDITGTAAAATKLATARSIALGGLLGGSANFDGSGNVTITATMAAGALTISNVNGLQGALDAKANLSGAAFTGDISTSGGVAAGWNGSQGGQIIWNIATIETGETSFVNNKGGGGGGFVWFNRGLPSASLGAPLMALGSAGNLSIAGGLNVATNAGLSLGSSYSTVGITDLAKGIELYPAYGILVTGNTLNLNSGGTSVNVNIGGTTAHAFTGSGVTIGAGNTGESSIHFGVDDWYYFSNAANMGWYSAAGGYGLGMVKSTKAITAYGALNAVGALSGNRIFSGWDSGTAGSISCSQWFRTTGQTGIYFSDYGSGWYMTDTTYVRTYQNKPVVASDFVISSDRRLKAGIRPLEYKGRLTPVSYVYKADGMSDFGFIAQDVQTLYPDAVTSGEGDEHMLKLSYGKLTAVLSHQINTLEDAFIELKASHERLLAAYNMPWYKRLFSRKPQL